MSRKPNPGRPSQRGQEGITAISVSGYKSICDDCRLEVRPLTILAGANSSGKSSAIQPLLLLKQTLDQSYDPGPLLLDGGNVRFTAADQLLSRTRGRRQAEEFRVSIEMEAEGAQRLSLVFRKHTKGGFAVRELTRTYPSRAVTLRPGMSREEIRALHLAIETAALSLAGFTELVVKGTRCFVEVGVTRSAKSHLPGFPDFQARFSPQVPFDGALRGLIHVPGLRGNPMRAYPTSGTGPLFPGTFEHYIASLIYQWQIDRDERLDRLGEALATLGLTWKVVARPLDDTRIELLVPRLPHKTNGADRDLVNIADVGFGVSQALPPAVALLVAEPGRLVYIDEPELHLHPRAAVHLAGLLAEAASRGVRVVVETHSSLLLLGIQTLVAEGELRPEIVKLHWFKRGKDGATRVKGGHLDQAGAFNNWPVDFGDVELEAQSRYLDAGR